MTLFTMLLVIIAERLFKLGEHWHLDHRLEVLFRRIKHFSMLRTLLMMAGVMVITFLLLRALYGLFFNVPLLVVWILLGVLCIGAGKVRLHYHAYLKAASRDDAHARNAMASELTMIHGVPLLPGAAVLVCGGRSMGTGLADGVCVPARLADLACPLSDAARAFAVRH
jgi:AmpE protein